MCARNDYGRALKSRHRADRPNTRLCAMCVERGVAPATRSNDARSPAIHHNVGYGPLFPPGLEAHPIAERRELKGGHCQR